MERHPKKLSPEFSGALRIFGFWLDNGTVGHPLLEGFDYWPELRESPSLLEEVMAIFANVLKFDDAGVPVNAKYAEHRAAQAIRRWRDTAYQVGPPYENWETSLFAPPARTDTKPWPKGSK